MATTKSETRADRPATAPAEPAGLVLLNPRMSEIATKLDAVREECATAISKAHGHMVKAFLTAKGVLALRNLLTDEVMKEILPLMNSKLGFVTDRGMERSKEKTPYAIDVVRDCVVEAMLGGFYLTGNEFNIISGGFYGTQNGFRRKLESVPGISDIRMSPGVPGVHNGQPVCRIALSWVLDGKTDCLTGPDGKPGQPFPLISHGNASPDQLIGKAKRKAYKLAFEQATGSKCTVEDREVGEPDDSPAIGSKSAQVLGTLGEKAAEKNGKNGSTEHASAQQNQQIDALVNEMTMDPALFNEKCAEIGADPARPTKEQASLLIAWLLEKANKGEEQPA